MKIISCGCVLKKDKLIKNRRWLYLTKDNLFQKDENDMVVKGQIKLEKNIIIEYKNEHKFNLVNSQKKYKIYTDEKTAMKWVEKIQEVIDSKLFD